jgi:hypothetical protein
VVVSIYQEQTELNYIPVMITVKNPKGWLEIKDVSPLDYMLVKEEEKLNRAECNENEKEASTHFYAIALLTSIKNLDKS